MSDDRTEEASHKKLADARKRGEVWRSKDLGTAAVVLATAGALVASGDGIRAAVTDAIRSSIAAVRGDLAAAPAELLGASLTAGLAALAPVLGAAAIAGGVVAYLQVGPVMSFDPIAPKLSRLDPIAATKNLFSTKRAIELGKSALTIGLVAWAAWGALEASLRGIVGLAARDAEAALGASGDVVSTLLLRAGGAIAAVAVLDVFYQRWRFGQDQKMTKDEVKREHKESEGDPHAKQHRDRMHREIVEHAAVEDVRRADVLIVNPTHLAVALRYDEDGEAEAPEVIAKGRDDLAQRMIAAANESGIPILRDVPLARALFELEVGDEIPESLYEAVAIVLRAAWAEREQGDAEAGAP